NDSHPVGCGYCNAAAQARRDALAMTRFSRVTGSNSADGAATPTGTTSDRDAISNIREYRSLDSTVVAVCGGREDRGNGKCSTTRGRTKNPLFGRAWMNPRFSSVRYA